MPSLGGRSCRSGPPSFTMTTGLATRGDSLTRRPGSSPVQPFSSPTNLGKRPSHCASISTSGTPSAAARERPRGRFARAGFPIQQDRRTPRATPLANLMPHRAPRFDRRRLQKAGRVRMDPGPEHVNLVDAHRAENRKVTSGAFTSFRSSSLSRCRGLLLDG